MAGELPEPGVEILQTRKTATPSFVRPTLVPCVIGAAYEVINVLLSDGTLNPKAKFGAYTQLPLAITESSFPDPRDNIAELTIQPDTVRPFMLAGGKLGELVMNPGQAFLAVGAASARAAIRTLPFHGSTGLALNGLVMTLAIDIPTALDHTNDVTVIFRGSGNLKSSDVVSQINAALGQTVAEVVGTAPNDQVQISSLTYGALSSVTVRAGGSANSILGIGFVSSSAAHEERVEGYGWRGQDQNNNTTKTPWIEFYRGDYLVDGISTTIPSVSSSTKCIGFIDSTLEEFSNTKGDNFSFSDNSMPLHVGDFFFADGVRLASGEVSKVEAKRFKIGTVNPALSTADENGNYTSKVYDTQTVGTPFDVNPFAPRYSYFRATGLDWSKLAPTSATMLGAATLNPGVVNDATSASAQGSAVSGSTLAVAGLRLHYVVTIDGVDTEGIFTFTGGPFVDVPAVTAAKASLDLHTVDTNIATVIEAKNTGAAGNSITIAAVADDSSGVTINVAGNAVTIHFKSGTAKLSDVETAIGALAGANAIIEVKTADPSASSKTLASGDAFAATHLANGQTASAEVSPMTQLATSIGSGIPGVLAQASADAIPAALTLSTLKVGRLQNIVIKADGTANAALGFSTTVDTDASLNTSPCISGKDVEYVGITGTSLKFQLDNNPHVYTVVFSTDSLNVSCDAINGVVGATVAQPGGETETQLLLTSPLKGLASDITIIDQYDGSDPTTKGAEWLFMVNESGTAEGVFTAGAKRPYPDAYQDDALVLHIQSQILRDLVTGFPLDEAYNSGTLYVQFKALRKDVSAVAQVAGVIRMSDVATLSAVLDPLTEENPLGLGMYLMMLNAPTFECKGLGIDEVSAAAPEGTGPAWARAAGLLEAEEVYALAPLTQDEVAHSMWITHADVMSGPEEGGERIVFFNKKMPSRNVSGIALSGSQANTTSNENEVHLDGDPTSGLLALGIRGPAISEDKMVYLEITVDDELRRYNVAYVNGALIDVRTSFSSSDTNVDDFFSTAAIDTPIIDQPYSLKVRGASLVIPGSNPSRLDYGLVSETVATANSTFADRRAYSVFPDTIKTTIAGIEKKLPGYYGCACAVGMVASKPPQQPFTNYPMTGLTGVVGTEKFTKRQLNVMAGGGTYILMQDAIGAPVVCRHQLSTDTGSVETRELSITKVVDFTAKILRLAVRKFIGINVINAGLLDSLSTTTHAVLKFLEEAGVLNGSAINNIMQDATNKDTVLIDVTLDVPYPCNYIKLTLVI